MVQTPYSFVFIKYGVWSAKHTLKERIEKYNINEMTISR